MKLLNGIVPILTHIGLEVNAYFRIKNYDAVIADCEKVINGAPNFPDAYIIRGDAYGTKGIYHKAVADYKTGLEKGFDPNRLFSIDKSNKSDMWFCGAMYMEIVANRFLGKSDVVAKYENWLKTVCDKNGVTRAEIEAYYRDGIRGLIADIVNEEFNKISFMADINAQASYDCVLTRNPQNGHYTLSYERASVANSNKTLTAPSLNALLAEMRNGENKADFTPAVINTVRAQAALIPAVAYPASTINEVVNTIVDFYLNPNTNTFNALRSRYRTFLLSDGQRGKETAIAFSNVLYNLSIGLNKKLSE